MFSLGLECTTVNPLFLTHGIAQLLLLEALNGGSQGSTSMCELTRDLHPFLSPSCVAEDLWFGEGLGVCLDRGYPRLQLTSCSPPCEVKVEAGP